MKIDVWTKVVMFFVVGVLVSSVGFTDAFEEEDAAASIPALLQGVALYTDKDKNSAIPLQ